MKRRMAFISSHPAPYRDAFIDEFVRCAKFDVDVYTIFTYDKGHDFWNLSAPRHHSENLGGASVSSWRLMLKLLSRFVLCKKYDFVLWPCWAYSFLKLPIFLSALLGRQFGVAADSVEQRKISRFSSWVKEFIVKRASLIFVPGKAGKSFFASRFSKNDYQIKVGSYSLDGVALEKEIYNRRVVCRPKVRNELGISENAIVYLMVANMIPTRHYPITVSGFIEFHKKCRDACFIIVGKGADLRKMQDIANANSCIKVIPGCSFNNMLDLYSAADIYVHGGKEPASTALVIGAIARLPLISSKAVGCSADLLVDGGTGYLVNDYLASDEWARIFERSCNDRTNWRSMGNMARELSKGLDATETAPGLAAFISDIIK